MDGRVRSLVGLLAAMGLAGCLGSATGSGFGDRCEMPLRVHYVAAESRQRNGPERAQGIDVDSPDHGAHTRVDVSHGPATMQTSLAMREHGVAVGDGRGKTTLFLAIDEAGTDVATSPTSPHLDVWVNGTLSAGTLRVEVCEVHTGPPITPTTYTREWAEFVL